MLETRLRSQNTPAGRMDAVRRHLVRGGLGTSLDFQRLELLVHRPEIYPPKTTLQTEGEPVRRPRFLISGWACRLRDLSDGRRQVFDFVVPGDGLGVCLSPAPLARTTTMSLTRVELVDAGELLRSEVLRDCPEIGRAFEWAEEEDHQRLLDHVVRLGRLGAMERVAHLLLELHDRLSVVGLVRDGRFPMPLTQEVLADSLGLSVVHLNRTLQEMRRQDLAMVRCGEGMLVDRSSLALMCDYAPRDPAGLASPAPRRSAA